MVAEITMRRRDGTVRAIVLVDESDYDWLNQWRWSYVEGYARRIELRDGRRYSIAMSRQILGLGHGDARQADHKNRNRLDNRRENLRIVSGNAANHQNRPSRRGATSKHRGVSWKKREKKWVAQICVNRKVIWLGAYDDEDEAAEVARQAREQMMPHALD